MYNSSDLHEVDSSNHLDDETYKYEKCVLENMSGLLSYWDKDEVCRYANDVYITWLDIHPFNLINKITLKKFVGPFYTYINNNVKEVLKGNTQIFEQKIFSHYGKSISCVVTLTPHIVNGSVEGFVAHVVKKLYPYHMTNTQNNHPMRDPDSLMEQIAEYLEQEMFNKFPGLEKIANLHYISVSKLKRDFKKKFNKSPFNYFRNLQMEFSENAINGTKFTKKELAGMFKFSSASIFYICYRKYSRKYAR